MQNIYETITMLYGCISFHKGGLPDVKELKQLFIEGGQLINNSREYPTIYTIDSFIEAYTAQLNSGTIWQLKEIETHAVTEEFGKIAHRFSTYSLFINDQDKPLSRGINSIQLIKQDDVWKVTCLIWDEQKESLLIPEKYMNTL